MKQDIFNLTNIFMNNHHKTNIKIHFHDSTKDALSKEIGDLQKDVNKMAQLVDKLTVREISIKRVLTY